MKITVIGSVMCPDTLLSLCKLRENNIEVDFHNLTGSLKELKEYLTLRENDEIYDSVRKAGNIGIPCFILENGEKTMDLSKVLGE